MSNLTNNCFSVGDLYDVVKNNPSNARKILTEELDEILVNHALVMHRGNQTDAAKQLGISRSALRQKISNAKQRRLARNAQ